MKLFEPARIGTMELKNRIIMAPMGTHFGAEGNGISPRQITYYARRATGGAGLITLEITGVHPMGRSGDRQPAIWDDRFIPGLRALAEAIHAAGAKAAVQLHHCGRRSRPAVIGAAPVAPSPIPCPVNQAMPRELAIPEVEELVDAFAEGARRAREAGFDAVEVHGTHGYLIAQFLSPSSNKRTDEYGGTLKRRARFALEIVRRIHDRAGADFPVIFRISGTEFLEDGLSPEEAKQIAVMLEDAGADAIHVSAGTSGSREQTTPPVLIPKGHLVEYAAGIKAVIKIPVIAVAGINNLGLATAILRDNKADFVALARPLLADADLPNKWRDGRDREVTMCIACNSCMDGLHSGAGLRCLMNPLVGREEFREEPAAEPKRVLVYGSGPGALECARVARIRGHAVCLATDERKIAGRWTWLISPFVYAKSNELRAAGVEMKLGRALDSALIEETRPQVVVLEETLAPVAPAVPGAESARVCTADQLLSGQVPLAAGQSMVIVGAGNAGCEVAEHVLRRGIQPTIVDAGIPLCEGFEAYTRIVLARKLTEEGATILEKAQVTAVTDEGVTVAALGGEERSIPADLVVVALGYKSAVRVPSWIAEAGLPAHILKSCQSPRQAFDIMESGAALARQI